jgi:hypothetical protein
MHPLLSLEVLGPRDRSAPLKAHRLLEKYNAIFETVNALF